MLLEEGFLELSFERHIEISQKKNVGTEYVCVRNLHLFRVELGREWGMAELQRLQSQVGTLLRDS